MIFPKVTTDENEFKDYLLYFDEIEDYHSGAYCNNFIWLRKLNFQIIMHEYIHHVMRSCTKYNIRFGDLINETFDLFDGFIGARKYDRMFIVFLERQILKKFFNPEALNRTKFN